MLEAVATPVSATLTPAVSYTTISPRLEQGGENPGNVVRITRTALARPLENEPPSHVTQTDWFAATNVPAGQGEQPVDPGDENELASQGVHTDAPEELEYVPPGQGMGSAFMLLGAYEPAGASWQDVPLRAYDPLPQAVQLVRVFAPVYVPNVTGAPGEVDAVPFGHRVQPRAVAMVFNLHAVHTAAPATAVAKPTSQAVQLVAPRGRTGCGGISSDESCAGVSATAYTPTESMLPTKNSDELEEAPIRKFELIREWGNGGESEARSTPSM